MEFLGNFGVFLCAHRSKISLSIFNYIIVSVVFLILTSFFTKSLIISANITQLNIFCKYVTAFMCKYCKDIYRRQRLKNDFVSYLVYKKCPEQKNHSGRLRFVSNHGVMLRYLRSNLSNSGKSVTLSNPTGSIDSGSVPSASWT